MDWGDIGIAHIPALHEIMPHKHLDIAGGEDQFFVEFSGAGRKRQIIAARM